MWFPAEGKRRTQDVEEDKGILLALILTHYVLVSYQTAAGVARRQHGVISVDQLRAHGVSSKAITGLLQADLLERVAFRTYRYPAVDGSWNQDVMTAVLTAGPDALASHATAATLHGLLDRPLDLIEVVVPRWRRRHHAFVVHESKDLMPGDRIVVEGIPATAPTRTVVDLGASAPWLVEKALDRALRGNLATLEGVAGFIGRVARKGRSGVGVVRPLVEARLRWQGMTESDFEDLFRRVWGDRVPQPVAQYEITDARWGFICRADFAFPRHKIRIELDSEAFHMDRPTFQKDRQIQNRTELLGWKTLRYTWWDLTSRPEVVVDQVTTALRSGVHGFPHG